MAEPIGDCGGKGQPACPAQPCAKMTREQLQARKEQLTALYGQVQSGPESAAMDAELNEIDARLTRMNQGLDSAG